MWVVVSTAFATILLNFGLDVTEIAVIAVILGLLIQALLYADELKLYYWSAVILRLGAHRDMFYLWTFLLGALLWGAVFTASWHYFVTKPLPEPRVVVPAPENRLPVFSLRTAPVNVPENPEGSISFSNIRNRRLQLLEIHNPNKTDLIDLQLRTQFSEAILRIQPGERAAAYRIRAEEDWDRQQVSVSGEAAANQRLEPFATEEKTGLWSLSVDRLPAQGTAKIEFMTTSGEEAGLYSRAISLEGKSAQGARVFHISGTYRHAGGTSANERFVVPLEVDNQERTMKALPAVRSPLKDNAFARIRQGRGFRIPGIFAARGYLFNESKEESFYAEMKPERKDIGFRFGLAGTPPMQPFFQAWWLKQGSERGVEPRMKSESPAGTKVAPSSFLQLAGVRLLTKELAANIQLSMNVAFTVKGTQPVQRMYFAQSIMIVDYDGPERDPSAERMVRSNFDGVIKEQQRTIETQGLRGQSIGLNQVVSRQVDSSPLTQKQVQGILTGQSRVYLLTWAIWENSEGRAGRLETCQWLQAPPSLKLTEHETVWQLCMH